jgi:circadian clock protein KaiC
LIVGAPGTGKSSLAVAVGGAVRRGERSARFIFDESVTTLGTRCAGLGMDGLIRTHHGLALIRPWSL